ncbi:hypothetical protein ABEF93_007861 [Exophiala dermatitidis]
MLQNKLFLLFANTLPTSAVSAQFTGWWGDSDNGDGSGPPGSWGGSGNSNNDGDGTGSSSTWQFGQDSVFGSSTAFNRAGRILIGHAVLASLVWVIFIPSLAILLRLDLKSPMVLRIHAVGQIVSYIIYIGAAGMGIWLAQQSSAFGVWNDPHPRLGLAILAMGLFQPVFGAIHHSIYKKRALNAQAGRQPKAPGRTWVGRVHLWLGRLLLCLGVINGGLGIRLASQSPFQTNKTSNKVRIAYGVVAGVIALLYLIIVSVFEARRMRHQNERRQQHVDKSTATTDRLPTYEQSEESLGSNRRYG